MDTLIKEIAAANGHYKAVIRQRSKDVLTVEIFRWTHEIVDGHEVCDPYWDRIQGPIWTDTIARAEQLANEELHIRFP